MKKIAFLGLGNFGLPIALNLIDKGYWVTGLIVDNHNKLGAKQLEKSGGKIVHLKSSETLPIFDILVTCLPLQRNVLENLHLLGKERLPNQILDLSTGCFDESVEIYEYAKSLSKNYIDSPVSGSKTKAREGSLTLFVGGRENSLDPSIIELLNSIGNNIFYFGSVGQGCSAKLINQFMHLNIMSVIREALILADNLQIERKQIINAILTSSGNSEMLKRFGQGIIENDHSPQFTLKNAFKDLKLIEKSIGNKNLDVSLLNYSMKIMNDYIEEKKSELNFSIICSNLF